jgi:hypothetical protein
MKNSWRNSITSIGLTEPVSHSKFRTSNFRFERLRSLAGQGALTLLTATKEPSISAAAVLCALINQGRQPGQTHPRLLP